jgi:hypothetical protein
VCPRGKGDSSAERGKFVGSLEEKPPAVRGFQPGR